MAITDAVAAAGRAERDLDVQTKSAPGDFVTEADLASEAAILEVLATERPDDEVLAEESGSHPGSTGLRWLIDPLDGTANFVHGRREYAVSVGVEHLNPDAGGQPAGQAAIAGAIALPSFGILHAAGADQAPGDHPAGLLVSGCAGLADAMIGIGYPRGQAREAAHVWFGDLLRDIRDYRRIGSSACDLVAVATGAQDGYVAFGVLPWDVGGGFALVRAAGGTASWVTAASGRNVAVAGAPAVFDDLAERVAACQV